MVLPEQGFGDNIQFVRYLALLKYQGASRVHFYCKEPLLRLLRSASGTDEVFDVSLPPKLVGYDYWTLLMSIPLHVGTTLESIPSEIPYLAAPENASYLAGQQNCLRIGLVWRGSRSHPNDRNRSLPSLSTLAPLWSVPNIEFVSLQKGVGEDEASPPPIGQPLYHVGSEIGDFADAADAIDQLDLLICVDTAFAHLAGALGKPCWILLPYDGCDWRWLTERSDSPWYPGNVRLFRQPAPGAWDIVVNEVVEALSEQLRSVRPANGSAHGR
jgi:hypothetical protein